MGRFNVQTRIIGPTGVSELLDLFVDTGATLIILPRAIAERLDLRPTQTCQVELAGGVEQTWPIAEIRVVLEGRKAPMLCLISEGGAPVLGVVALESLGLVVDPVRRRLAPGKFFAMPSTHRSLAERLELRAARTLAIVTAGGREEVWPLAGVQIELEGHEVPTPCLIAPDGPPLLGAVALESLVLAVDPVTKRLLPSKAYVLEQRVDAETVRA